jgi:DNA-binding XRE family transcriptional regulator
VDVDYSKALGVLVFKFPSGKSYAVPLTDFDVADRSDLSKVTIMPDGDAAVVEQESGNTFEIPWDAVLYHAEPSYPYYKHKQGSVEQSEERAARIGQRVKEQRGARGWTLATLEAKTGIKAPNLSRLEKGKHVPSLETLERIAEAFGVGVAELIARHAS